MLDKNLLKKIKKNFKEIETIESRKIISREFIKRGIQKKRAYDIFKDLDSLENATNDEVLSFICGVNRVSKNKIDVSNYFSKEEIESFEKIKMLDDYIPSDLDQNDKYQVEKILFLNESYHKENTKSLFWHLYTRLLYKYEVKYEKDLYDFNKKQIEDMMKDIDVAITTRRNLISFLQRYLDWCVLEEFVNKNILNEMDLNSLLFANGVEKEKVNYISLEELFKDCYWLTSKGDNDITELDVVIVLLMRKGLRTKDIVNLKYSDINYKTGELDFVSDGKKINITLEKPILRLIEEVEETVYLVGASKRPLRTIDGHLVKTLDLEYDKEKIFKNIKKRVSKFKECYRTLNENILINSCKFDELDLIKENNNNNLEVEDYKNIQMKYGNSANSYQKLKLDYELYKKHTECGG